MLVSCACPLCTILGMEVWRCGCCCLIDWAPSLGSVLVRAPWERSGAMSQVNSHVLQYCKCRNASAAEDESPDFMTRGNREGRFALENNGKKSVTCKHRHCTSFECLLPWSAVQFVTPISATWPDSSASWQCDYHRPSWNGSTKTAMHSKFCPEQAGSVSMSSQPLTCRSTALAASSAHERSREAAHVD
jgi:hypothetical protein